MMINTLLKPGQLVVPCRNRFGSPSRIPIKAVLVCIHQMNLGVGHVHEDIFFNRSGEYDELWTQQVGSSFPEPVFRIEKNGSELEAACFLLKKLFRSRVNYSFPTILVCGGLVSAKHFDEVTNELIDASEFTRYVK